MSGWIKIHRSITNHWLYTEKRVYSKLEAWYDIIMNVNYIDNKVIIKGNLYEVKRGQSILSLDSWSKRWNWDKSKVRRFLKTLQLDNMIVIESDTVTTQLTVCNYDSYQSEKTISETQTKRKRNADETQTTPIEERKKERKKEQLNTILSDSIIDKNQEKKIDLEKRTLEFKEIVKSFSHEYDIELLKSFFYYWSEPTQDNKFKMKYEIQKTWSIKGRLRTWKNNNYGNNNQNKTNETGIKSKERINAYFDLVNRYKNG